jgi:diaminopimelate epimerase
MANIKFVKMHGLGNDFVMLDCRKKKIANLAKIAEIICDRRFGIGCDQIIVILPSKVADYRMQIFNADGSEVEMCGNGIRCFAKYLWDRKEKKLCRTKAIEVETLAGIIRPRMVTSDLVEVDMGEPILDGLTIPTSFEGAVVDQPMAFGHTTYNVTAVSMGNPHAIVFCDDVDSVDLEHIGPRIERDTEKFPNRINVEFVQVLSKGRVKARVWERGSGITLACGTGACAVGVAAALNKKTGRKVSVDLPGGRLIIHWTKDNRVMMTGPAEEVFSGTISL